MTHHILSTICGGMWALLFVSFVIFLATLPDGVRNFENRVPQTNANKIVGVICAALLVVNVMLTVWLN